MSPHSRSAPRHASRRLKADAPSRCLKCSVWEGLYAFCLGPGIVMPYLQHRSSNDYHMALKHVDGCMMLHRYTRITVGSSSRSHVDSIVSRGGSVQPIEAFCVEIASLYRRLQRSSLWSLSRYPKLFIAFFSDPKLFRNLVPVHWVGATRLTSRLGHIPILMAL